MVDLARASENLESHEQRSSVAFKGLEEEMPETEGIATHLVDAVWSGRITGVELHLGDEEKIDLFGLDPNQEQFPGYN